MENPLLQNSEFPLFSKVSPNNIEPALDVILDKSRKLLKQLLEQTSYSWGSLIQPLEDDDIELSNMWSIVEQLNSVANSEALRESYNQCLPKLTEYATEVSQNEKLFQAFQQIQDSKEFNQLNTAQQKIITDALRDFKLSGVSLTKDKKQRFAKIQQRLAQLSTKYEENVLDATNGWSRLISDETLLKGLPEYAKENAKLAAKNQGKQGWLLGLDFPSYYAAMTYLENRNLREEMYKAYVTRASDQGPNANKWDNTKIMEEIVALRQEKAKLLDFNNYAELSLATKMANDPQQVLAFLEELLGRSKAMAQKEKLELLEFAKKVDDLDELQAWDVGFYSEKLRQEKYAVSQEELRPYFPLEQVLDGMFTVVNRLYGIHLQQRTENIDVWDESVTLFDIYRDQDYLGSLYMDLYARPSKRQGAWMDSCRQRHKNASQQLQKPIAYLNCNFTPPDSKGISCLTHEEVLTIFHEFGHCLHHLLTQIDYSGVSGISGVAWDAVELPSQFMENWCWQKQGIDLISKHYKTGEALPEDLLQKLLAAKNFQSGVQMLRQLQFAIFDFRLHMEYCGNNQQIQTILDEVRERTAVFTIPDYNRFQHGFSHIFAGGYAAGYYSYKWAEVLSCDVFTKFREHGIFDAATGQKFWECILSQGGSKEAMELFVDFMGREPKIDALLKDSGIE